MVVPASIYMLFNLGKPSAGGWGIPMATDIAFALGALTALMALGSRIPLPLKVFLVAVSDFGRRVQAHLDAFMREDNNEEPALLDQGRTRAIRDIEKASVKLANLFCKGWRRACTPT